MTTMRRTRPTITALLSLLGALLWPMGSSDAAPAPPPPPAPAPDAAQAELDTKAAEAQRLYREGNEAVDAGQLDQARVKYLQAYSLRPSFDIAGNLGAVELVLGRYRDAAEHLEFSLRHAPVHGDAALRAKTEQLLSRARKRIGSIAVSVDVEAATVSLDDRSVGTSPLGGMLFVEPGAHRLSASKPGYHEVAEPFEIAAGQNQMIALRLRPIGPGGDDPGELEPAGIEHYPWVVAGLGTWSVGLLTAGAVLVGVGANKQNEAEQRENERQGFDQGTSDLYGAADHGYNVGGGLLIVGTLSAAATVVYAVLQAPASEDAQGAGADERAGAQQWMPIVGPGTAGLGWKVIF